MSSPENSAAEAPRVLFFVNYPPPQTGQRSANLFFQGALDGWCHVEGMPYVDAGDLPDSHKSVRHGWKTMRNVSKARRRLEEGGFTHLYVNLSNSRVGMLRDAYAISRLAGAGRQIVAHLHCGNFETAFGHWGGWPGKLYRRLVHQFVFLSPVLATKCEEHLAPEQIAVCPNSIAGGLVFGTDEVEEKIKARCASKTFEILFLGHMFESKGYLRVAEGVAAYRQQHPDVDFRLRFVGSWPADSDPAEFERRLSDLGIAGQTEVLEPIRERPALKQLLAETDVLVFPTSYPNEAQPLTILESMNAGAPVIATDWASISDSVKTGETGVLLENSDPDTVSAALAQVHEAKPAGNLCRGAWAVFEKTFSQPAVTKTFRALFE